MSASEAVSFTRAGELLGLTGEQVFDLVFTRQLAFIEKENGRWLVPLSAIEEWRANHPTLA